MDKISLAGASRRAALAPTRPDYATWALRETWSVSEGGKLVCGRNPYDKIPGPQLYNRERRVIDVIDAAFEAAQRGEMKVVRSALLPIHLLVEPASFVAWATRFGLTVPDELDALGIAAAEPGRVGAETLIRERVQTVARTLWILEPELSVGEVVTHRAMRVLVPENDALTADKLRWAAEARER